MFQFFSERVAEIKARYIWIYNPPVTAQAGELTEGSYLRTEFVSHYGAYMEVAYLLCNGDFTKLNEILEWSTERFLFQGEYLVRKKIIENIK